MIDKIILGGTVLALSLAPLSALCFMFGKENAAGALVMLLLIGCWLLGLFVAASIFFG